MHSSAGWSQVIRGYLNCPIFEPYVAGHCTAVLLDSFQNMAMVVQVGSRLCLTHEYHEGHFKEALKASDTTTHRACRAHLRLAPELYAAMVIISQGIHFGGCSCFITDSGPPAYNDELLYMKIIITDLHEAVHQRWCHSLRQGGDSLAHFNVGGITAQQKKKNF